MVAKNVATKKNRGEFDTLEFAEGFAGTALNTGKWLGIVTTMAIAVASGFVQLNSAGVFGVGNVARIASCAFFSFISAMAKFAKFSFRLSVATPPTGSVVEFGFMIATGVAAPTLGAFFRVTPANGLQAVINFNGTETAVSCKDPTANQATILPDVLAHVAWIVYDDDQVEFWIDNLLVASIATEGPITARTSSAMPFMARVYYASAGTVAIKLDIGHLSVWGADSETSKPWGHIMATMGHHGYQGQSGGTMGSLAALPNAVAAGNPTAAAPSNTAAQLGTGLGGQFLEIDTLAVDTDGIIDSYQIPGGTVDIPGMRYVCTGVKVSSFVQTALTGGGANEVWSLAFGHTSVSLATTENAATGAKAPRRIPIGSRQKPAAAAVLTQLTDLALDLSAAPVVVNPGEFVAVVKKNRGTVGTGGQIQHTITLLGYFE